MGRTTMSRRSTRTRQPVSQDSVGQLPYPDGAPIGPLQQFVAELDDQQFTPMELLPTDDKLIHALMATKGNSAEAHEIHRMTFYDKNKVDRIAGYLTSRVYTRLFPPHLEHANRTAMAEECWAEVRRVTGTYYNESERRAFV